MDLFRGRVGVVQHVLTPYRVPVYDLLAAQCTEGLAVFAGEPHPGESIAHTTELSVARYVPARNRRLLGGRLALGWQGGLVDWLEAWQPDALIADANPRYLSTRRAITWMHRRGRPVLGHGLGVMPLTPGLQRLRAFGRRRLLHRFDGLIAYSSRAAEQYRAMGIPPDRVFVAYNAVAHRPTSPLPSRPPSFPDGSPRVLFVGRLTGPKRIDLLIRACGALRSMFHPRLRIVGDGPARGELESLAKACLPETTFLGARYGDELAAAFADADLFVLPGLGGLAIQEAMSYGLPVIVAEGDGTQDDLVRPETGWNIPAGDDSALLGALRAALSDPERLRRMGAAARRVVEDEINIERMVEAIVIALNSVRNPTRRG
ncbi:MAG: glycosyltransferase family 4 protein [Phycisphaerales bacterium]|nr:glycosyltransferase family 4 protein [Phycisphaerales bacterium]